MDVSLFKNRFKELATRSYQNNQYTYTDFLSISEIDMFYQVASEIDFVRYEISGGGGDNERQMIRFGDSELVGYEERFPIDIIKAEPLIAKFADDLTHRDFLGALMNLGIERDTIGDIFVNDKTGFIFCNSKLSEYIIEKLTKIKHTQIKCKIIVELPEIAKPKFEEVNLSVSSMRADIIIAKTYNLSRNQSLELFREKKVFVNSKNIENTSMILKEGDIVSLRGYGKFIYHGIHKVNKKGKFNIKVEKYV